MIIGMPGCGKSLTAKAAASLFNIPLVRLDVGRLLGKYVGESEDNMRRALDISEAISPCVLWVDEIEKAFAGIRSTGSGAEVTTRLFGQFLTWMQEKDNAVFIIATANDISRLPPEFLRKGRFDELFFVDLPNSEERRKILEIHLKKRGKWNREIDTIALLALTEGFNGADLEAVVKDTIERAFIKGKEKITTEDLVNSAKDTKSLSMTLKDEIAKIRAAIGKSYEPSYFRVMTWASRRQALLESREPMRVGLWSGRLGRRDRSGCRQHQRFKSAASDQLLRLSTSRESSLANALR